MNDVLESTLDLLSWILAGTFLGLSALGGLYFFSTYNDPPTPDRSVEPVTERRPNPPSTSKDFRPLEDFYLVQEYGELQEEKPPEPPEEASAETTPDRPTPPQQTEQISETDLPFKLVGTVTGSQNFQYAVVRNLQERKSRTLSEGDTWKSLEVDEIHDEKIIIRNNQNNQLEKLSLKKDENQRRP